VKSAEVPPFLDGQIRRQIGSQHVIPRKRWPLLTGATAVAGLALAAIVTHQIGGIRQTVDDQESFIVSVASHVGTLMQIGLGDHIHCSFFRKFPATAPAVEEMETKLGPEYKDLIPVVQKHVPERYQLVLGHKCRYRSRPFVHLSLKDDSQLLSLVIAEKRDGEAFDIQGVLPELVQAGIPMYTSTTDRFQIAAMESETHLVYFISDLPASQNTQMLVAMGPAIKTILENRRG
jgi:hypothetical protein